MKTHQIILAAALAFGITTWAASAQNSGADQGTPRRAPVSPIMGALDPNGDGIIDESEMANAAAELKKLDKNGDGKLTPDEYRPSQGAGRPAWAGGQGGAGSQGGAGGYGAGGGGAGGKAGYGAGGGGAGGRGGGGTGAGGRGGAGGGGGYGKGKQR